MPDLSTAADGIERIGRMAGILAAMSSAMDEQSEFHVDREVVFGTTNLREAAVLSARRAAAAQTAGPTSLREMERTVLFELAQAALLGATVVRQAASEVWPVLETVAAEARDSVRAAALRDPSLLGLPDQGVEEIAGLPAADCIGGDWRVARAGRFVMARSDGIVLTATLMPGSKGTGPWLARLGDIPVAIEDLAGRAAKAAQDASDLLLDADCQLTPQAPR